MKKIYIAGAGGFGQELASWLRSPGGLPMDWELLGFLDDLAIGEPLAGVAIKGSIRDFRPAANELLLMGAATPITKRIIHAQLSIRGATFVTYRHPTSIVAANAVLGDGCVLCPGALVSNRAVLSTCVTLNAYATIGHDTLIGAFSTASSHADVTGGAVIGQGVFLGSHASVLPGIRVEDRATVGAGSVALRNVGAGEVVFGVPAKRIFQH